MMDPGDQLNFFWGIHVGIEMRIDATISLRAMITKFVKHVHLEESTWMRQIKQADAGDVMVPRSRDKLKTYIHYQIVYRN